MSKLPSLSKSYFYNVLSQTLNVLYPLITLPYITRILGPEMLGKVNFAQSFVQYFIIFANFGILTYAVREISKVRESKEELNKVFSELFSLIFSSTLISSLIYISLFLLIREIKIDPYLYIIMGFSLFFNQMAVIWFFLGIEKFKYLSIRNILFKIVLILSIFVLVRDEKDYLIYGFLLSLSIFGTNILDFTLALKYVKIKISFNFFKHIKPLIILFLAGLFSVLYGGVEIIIIGIVQENPDKVIGIFSTAKKIVMTILFIVNSIISINYSRLSYLVTQNDKKEYEDFLKKTSNFIMLIVSFSCVFVLLFSKDILMILGGMKFIEGEIPLKILSLIIITNVSRNILESQVIIPNGKEIIVAFGNIISWIVMVIACFITIPKYSYIGAAVALLIGDLVNLTIFMIFSMKILKLSPFTKETIKYIVLGIIIILIHIILTNLTIVKESSNTFDAILKTFVLGSIYGMLYLSTLFIMRDPTINLILKTFESRIKMGILSKLTKGK